MYYGSEQFTENGKELEIRVQDFWRWAYGDFINNIQRGVLAEYIVSSAIGCLESSSLEKHREQWRPYDLLSPDGWKIEVKSAAYVQSWDSKHPDHVSYSIAPARIPDENGDYKDDSPKQRNSDAYIFALYKAMSSDEDPINLDLWEFRVLRTSILDAEKPSQKSITLPSLQALDPIVCGYSGLSEALRLAMA